MGKNDRKRKQMLSKASKGWKTQRELEFWFTPTQIKGEIPPDLKGTFLRNGPGLHEVYGTPLLHPIDGDGMICAITFNNGAVHFRSRFVKTKYHEEEKAQGRFIYRGQMGTDERSIASYIWRMTKNAFQGQFPSFRFRLPANTNSFYWGGKILACYETGLPHSLDPRTLETIGIDDLGGVLDIGTFAAHFRYDANIDRLLCMSHKPGLNSPATVAIYEFDRHWFCTRKHLHRIQGLNYAHDFIATKNYFIFQMSPFVKVTASSVMKIALGLTSPANLFHYYNDLPCRIVVIPRNAKDIMQFDIEPCHIYHFGNAYETTESNRIRFDAACLPPDTNMEFQHKVWLSNADDAPGRMFEYEIDMNNSTITQKEMDTCSCEFPSSHPYRHVNFTNAPSRFLYLMANDRGENLPFVDIVKYDAKKEARQVWHANGIIGEPVFVPRNGEESAFKGDEDDGWVLAQVYILEEHRTNFVILDAKDITKGPICTLEMLCHIPYGFHGTFTPHVFIDKNSSNGNIISKL